MEDKDRALTGIVIKPAYSSHLEGKVLEVSEMISDITNIIFNFSYAL